MSAELQELARLRRARDLMDREFAQPLDVATLAQHALMSPACNTVRITAVAKTEG